ncbi:helix-turn-helix transcriptional regulator [Spongiactinospora sp. TRM90649]|uniref:helix-turn-helix transcriptional regulator n=1 Tax=Spongiactinospora sp. TRM90649 TaxID=3031114 RepID=UPI0023F7A514|nr:helix-turn-helix transcriptional regulator [Spongiactinospora sp. TRM90649]MDF5752282.1 helix-turn-helix transcriptional regulator [Spongiactinospora sp. TRM90649]
MDRRQLAEFLRSRRARVTPREVGLPDGGRRRTPGLRRQEVAQLAGMSIDYYIRLEQGRGPNPSRQVLGALARALMLSADERAHLFHLSGDSIPPSAAHAAPARVPEAVRALLDSLEDVPAYVLDVKYDILAWNRMAELIMGELGAPGAERNVIRQVFVGPQPFAFVSHGEERCGFARTAVADLRASAARYPHDPGIRALVAEMLALSPEFSELWSRHEVAVRTDQRKLAYHPDVGEFQLICQVLHMPDRDQRVVFYTELPGEGHGGVLRLLRARHAV